MELGSPRGWGCLPLTGVRAPGDQLPWILRACEDPSAEGIRAEGQRVSPPLFHLTTAPGGPTRLPRALHVSPPPATPSYRLPLLSRQAPEASLSLKTLGEKNHEKLQGRAVPTQPLPPPHSPAALCSHSRQRWRGGGCWWPPECPQQSDHRGWTQKGNTVRGINSHIRVPLRSEGPHDGPPERDTAQAGDCHWWVLL